MVGRLSRRVGLIGINVGNTDSSERCRDVIACSVVNMQRTMEQKRFAVNNLNATIFISNACTRTNRSRVTKAVIVDRLGESVRVCRLRH